MPWLYKSLCEKNEARACVNDVDEEILKYCQVFAKRIKPLHPQPQLSDPSNLVEGHKMVKYYLLQWVEVWRHMLYTSTFNK